MHLFMSRMVDPDKAVVIDFSGVVRFELLPGGQPVHFDITAASYAAAPVSGRVTFQVRDYAPRKVAGERMTPFTLAPGASMEVPTDVAVAANIDSMKRFRMFQDQLT